MSWMKKSNTIRFLYVFELAISGYVLSIWLEIVFSCPHEPFPSVNSSFCATRGLGTSFYFPVIGREWLKWKAQWQRQDILSVSHRLMAHSPPPVRPARWGGGPALCFPNEAREQSVVSDLFFQDMVAVWNLLSPGPLLSSLNHTSTSLHLGSFMRSFPFPEHIFYNGWWAVCRD